VESRPWAFEQGEMGLAAHAPSRSRVDTGVAASSDLFPVMIENHIRTLLDAPEDGDDAPTLARIEEMLTTGHARAMAIEREQWRLQRRIVDVALMLADDYSELQAVELRKLARQLRAVDAELVSIRTLIRSLRARADDARAA
jgi:hypothetical protein